jgi:hypothetical protein
LKDLNLDFVLPDLEFVSPGLDFVPENLDFVPADFERRLRCRDASKSSVSDGASLPIRIRQWT